MKRRRLADLYVRGKEVELNDGSGEPVVVWLHKLNGVDRESCLRRANAAKARFMIEADHEDSETFQAMYAQVRDTPDREGLFVGDATSLGPDAGLFDPAFPVVGVSFADGVALSEPGATAFVEVLPPETRTDHNGPSNPPPCISTTPLPSARRTTGSIGS